MYTAAFLYRTASSEDLFPYYKNSCNTINHVPIAPNQTRWRRLRSGVGFCRLNLLCNEIDLCAIGSRNFEQVLVLPEKLCDSSGVRPVASCLLSAICNNSPNGEKNLNARRIGSSKGDSKEKKTYRAIH